MHLRPLNDADWPLVAPLVRECAAWAPFSVADLSDGAVTAVLCSADAVWRVAEMGARPLALVGLERIKWVDRVGEPVVAVLPEARNQGWGKQCAGLLHTLATDTLNLRRLQSVVLEDAPSRSLLEAQGFEVEGVLRGVRYRNGRYVDAVMYGWVR